MNPLIEEFFEQQQKDEAEKRAVALRQSHNDTVDLIKEMNIAIVPIAHSKIPRHCNWITVNGKRCEAWEVDSGVYLLIDFRLMRITTDGAGKTSIKCIRLKRFKKMPAKPSKSKKKSLIPLAFAILLKAKQFGVPQNQVSIWERRLDELSH